MPTSAPSTTSLQFIRFATIAAAFIVAQGCGAASPASNADANSDATAVPIPEARPASGHVASPEARVIVRFRAGSPDPSDAAFRARLASSAHVSRVELLRPMSGDAYVMTIGCADPKAAAAIDPSDACASAIRRLGATAWVTNVEIDGREKHQ